MNRPTFSVVIPTHNRPETLARAVESVSVQTYAPHEIIVVDDGSTAPAQKSLPDRYSDNVSHARSRERKGPAAARNIGAAIASGEFVAFVDDDDTWAPTKLEAVARCLEQHPDVDVAIHQTGYRMPGRVNEPTWAAVKDPVMRMVRSQPPHLDGVVVRTSVHLEVAFDETFRAAEDSDYLIRLARSGATMIETSAVLAVHGPGEPSVISIEARIEGRTKLLERHPEILTDPATTAFFYVRLGHLQRRAGQRSAAMGSFLKACRHQPLSPLGWKGLARTAVKGS